MLAVSGEAGLPGPSKIAALLSALRAGEASTAAGVLLTADALLGRDPGAASGRADGTPGPDGLCMMPGDRDVFDARLDVHAHVRLTVEPAAGGEAQGLEAAPAPFRPGLPVLRAMTGERLAVTGPDAARYGTCRFLTADRLLHLTFPFGAGTWFDGVRSAAI